MSNPLIESVRVSGGVPLGLRRRWWVTAALYGLGLLIMGWGTIGGSGYGLIWGAQSTAVALLILFLLRTHLPENSPPDQPAQIFSTLGWGNALSLGRGLLLAGLGGFLFWPWPEGWRGWMPTLLYSGAVLLDLFDGYVARRTAHQTTLGERLDVELDGLGIGLVIGLAVWYGQLPWFFLSLGVARFLFLGGMWWRERHGRVCHPLPPSRYRRYLAGFQMGFLSVTLWPITDPSGVTLAGLVYFVPIMIGFGRDWLVVSGRLDPTANWYNHGRALGHRWLGGWLPLGARLGLVLLWPGANWQGWPGLFAQWGATPTQAVWWAQGWWWVTAVLLLPILFGLAARWVALLLLFPISFTYLTTLAADGSAHWLSALLLLLVNFIILAGAGRGALFTPGEWFLFQRLGSENEPQTEKEP